MECITLAIVAQLPLLRDGLRALLAAEAGVQLAGEAGSHDEAVRLATARHPQILVIDAHTSGAGSWVEAVRQIHRVSPSTRVIVLATDKQHDGPTRALRSGAVGYIPETAGFAELLVAMWAAAGHLRGPSEDPNDGPGNSRPQSGGDPPASHTTPGYLLTPREREILQSVVDGLTNQQIARKHFISESAVRQHVSRIFDKMGVSGRAQAAAQAVFQRIVSVGWTAIPGAGRASEALGGRG